MTSIAISRSAALPLPSGRQARTRMRDVAIHTRPAFLFWSRRAKTAVKRAASAPPQGPPATTPTAEPGSVSSSSSVWDTIRGLARTAMSILALYVFSSATYFGIVLVQSKVPQILGWLRKTLGADRATTVEGIYVVLTVCSIVWGVAKAAHLFDTAVQSLKDQKADVASLAVQQAALPSQMEQQMQKELQKQLQVLNEKLTGKLDAVLDKTYDKRVDRMDTRIDSQHAAMMALISSLQGKAASGDVSAE